MGESSKDLTSILDFAKEASLAAGSEESSASGTSSLSHSQVPEAMMAVEPEQIDSFDTLEPQEHVSAPEEVPGEILQPDADLSMQSFSDPVLPQESIPTEQAASGILGLETALNAMPSESQGLGNVEGVENHGIAMAMDGIGAMEELDAMGQPFEGAQVLATKSIPQPSAQILEPSTYDSPEIIAVPAPALAAANLENQDFRELKKFGEKIAIGNPKLEGTPPFSLLLTFAPTESTKTNLLAILEAVDLGVRAQDVELQLAAGKLLIPHVSEYAAIHIAQKVREFVDDMDFGLASDVFATDPSRSFPEEMNGKDLPDDFESLLFDAEVFHSERADVHDLGAEPAVVSELFSTNLSEVPGCRVTRVLSTVSVTRVVSQDVIEGSDRTRLEKIHNEMTQELIHQAFALGAHGILGVSFTSKAAQAAGLSGPKNVYRLWVTATAVRVTPLT